MFETNEILTRVTSGHCQPHGHTVAILCIRDYSVETDDILGGQAITGGSKRSLRLILQGTGYRVSVIQLLTS